MSYTGSSNKSALALAREIAVSKLGLLRKVLRERGKNKEPNNMTAVEIMERCAFFSSNPIHEAVSSLEAANYRIVDMEPTDAMIKAAMEAWREHARVVIRAYDGSPIWHALDHESAAKVLRAALAAAPIYGDKL